MVQRMNTCSGGISVAARTSCASRPERQVVRATLVVRLLDLIQ